MTGWLAVFGCSATPPHVRSNESPCNISALETSRRRALATVAAVALISIPAWSNPPRFFVAPTGTPFTVQNPVPGNPGETARHFAQENAADLGIASPNVGYGIMSVRQRGQETFVRLRELYSGVPVFATTILVELDPNLGVLRLINGILPDTTFFDQGGLSLTPSVSSAQAVDFALQQLAPGIPPQEITVSEATLQIFDSRCLGLSDLPRLVWSFAIENGAKPQINGRILVDAHVPAIVRVYPHLKAALHRKIYDANDMNSEGALVRDEGDPACGITDADNAYDYLRDTYDYYLSAFSRDSYDGGGATIEARVRWCDSDPNSPCPLNNSFGSARNGLHFGSGWAVDDLVAHEFTHMVTDEESNLVYENAAGAINESLSDIFGELIDLTNGAGTDTATVRWQFGEDLAGGSIRDMQYPTLGNNPDRLSSPFYVAAVSDPNFAVNDNGGVHTNSGVSNKLFYLLCDGDTFNGTTTEAMGLDDPGLLFYTAQVRFLMESSDFYDLYDALHWAAEYIGWTAHDRNNLYNACKSVEIVRAWDIYVDYAAAGLAGKGFSNIPFPRVTDGVDAARPGDRLLIRAGDYQENLRIDEHLTLTTWEPNTTVSIGTH